MEPKPAKGSPAAQGSRGAAAVAAGGPPLGAEVHGVLDAVQRYVGLGEAQFLALVEVDRAGQGEREEGGGAGATGAQFQVAGDAERLGREGESGVLAAVAGYGAGDVVVAEDPGGRGADGGVFGEGVVDGSAQQSRVPGAAEEGEVEGGVQFVGAEVAGEALRVGEPDLADEDAAELVRDGAPAPVDVVQLVPVDVRVGPLVSFEVGEGWVLGDEGGGVDAHPGDASLEPEAQDVLVLLAYGGVRPVEVGLFGGEEVEVPLAVLDAGPGHSPNSLSQSLGGSSPCAPRPGRKWKSSRSGLPGPAASAAWNQTCWSETWLGTMSTMVRMPASRASAMSFSASARLPKAGSTAR